MNHRMSGKHHAIVCGLGFQAQVERARGIVVGHTTLHLLSDHLRVLETPLDGICNEYAVRASHVVGDGGHTSRLAIGVSRGEPQSDTIRRGKSPVFTRAFPQRRRSLFQEGSCRPPARLGLPDLSLSRGRVSQYRTPLRRDFLARNGNRRVQRGASHPQSYCPKSSGEHQDFRDHVQGPLLMWTVIHTVCPRGRNEQVRRFKTEAPRAPQPVHLPDIQDFNLILWDKQDDFAFAVRPLSPVLTLQTQGG